MKSNLICLLLVCTFSTTLFSQKISGFAWEDVSIPRIVDPHLDYMHINSGKVKKISVTMMINVYRSDTITYNLTYLSNNLKINEKLFRGDLKSALEQNIVFDPRNRILKIMNFYTGFDGRSIIDEYTYNYDKGILTSVYLDSFDKSRNKKFLPDCDSLGNPVKLTIKDYRDQIIGTQEASYDYDHNEITFTIKDASLKEISKRREILITKCSKGARFNEHGDVIFIPVIFNLCRTYEYQYDSRGNWTERREYESPVDHQSERRLLYTYTQENSIQRLKLLFLCLRVLVSDPFRFRGISVRSDLPFSAS